MSGTRRDAFVVGAAISLVAVAHDPDAPASDPQRTCALLLGAVAAAIALSRASHRASRDAERGLVRSVRPHRAALAALFVIGLSAMSLAWGRPRGALDLAGWIAGLALALFVASRGRAFALQCGRAAGVLAGAAVSSSALIAFARGARGIAIDGLQGNANWLGLVLAATLPFAIDAARAMRKRARAAAIGSVLLQAAALGASHARVAWVAAAIASLLLVRNPLRRRLVALSAVATIAFALLSSATALRAPRATRGGPAHAMRASSDLPYEAPPGVALAGRLTLARHALAAGEAHLPFGAGLGAFGVAYRQAQSEALAGLPPRAAAVAFLNGTTAHDEVLQVLAESGPFAACALVAAFVLAIRALFRTPAAAASLLAVAVCALADDPLRKTPVVLMVAVSFAALPRGGAMSVGVSSVVRRLVPAFALAATALSLVSVTKAWLSDRTVARADGEPTRELSLLARAVRIDGGSPDAWLALGIARLEAGQAGLALDALERARVLDDDVATEVALGNAQVACGMLEEAERSFRRALVWSPGSFRARVDLAEVLRRIGRLDDATAEARVARLLRPSDVAVGDLEERLAEDRIAAE